MSILPLSMMGWRRTRRNGENLERHAAAGEALTARQPTRRTAANVGGVVLIIRCPTRPKGRDLRQPRLSAWVAGYQNARQAPTGAQCPHQSRTYHSFRPVGAVDSIGASVTQA